MLRCVAERRLNPDHGIDLAQFGMSVKHPVTESPVERRKSEQPLAVMLKDELHTRRAETTCVVIEEHGHTGVRHVRVANCVLSHRERASGAYLIKPTIPKGRSLSAPV